MDTNELFENGLFSAPEELATRFSGKDNCPQQYRNMFMRDRDRILYSKSFRRLSGKTQIYLTGNDDHQRNRLTHTLEVSQISTTIAQALGLNRDLTEAIALGHDLGHTPFGHAGEQKLHSIMTPSNNREIRNSPYCLSDNPEQKESTIGFKHNLQSVRMVISLENIYGDNGLDLTNYTLWGLQRHSSNAYSKGKINSKYNIPTFYSQYKEYYFAKETDKMAWSFEAFVVAELDEIAQLHHDLDDAIRGNAMTRSEVIKTIKTNIGGILSDEDKLIFDRMRSRSLDDESFIVYLSRIVVNTLVSTLINASKSNLLELKRKYKISEKSKIGFFKNIDPESNEIKTAISYCKYDESDAIFKKLRKYSNAISTKVHNSMTVQRMNTKGQYIIRKLFQAYFANPQQLPNHSIVQFLIGVNEYKSKESAAKAIIKMGEGVVRTKFNKFYNSNRYDYQSKFELMRVICDHISCMTDNYAIEEFKRLYN